MDDDEIDCESTEELDEYGVAPRDSVTAKQ